MKTLTILVSLAAVPVAHAQIVDDLIKVGGSIVSGAEARNEKSKLSKAERSWNDAQPKVQLAGSTVEIRPSKSWRYLDEDEQGSTRRGLSAGLTAIGSRPVWNLDEIERESREREYLENNRYVDQTTVPGTGTIKVGRYILTFDFVEFNEHRDFELWLGRWSRGLSLNFSRESAYVGISVSIAERTPGEVIAVYKTIGLASNADNVGASIGGIFSDQIGVNINHNGTEGLKFRARENGLRSMGRIFAEKCR